MKQLIEILKQYCEQNNIVYTLDYSKFRESLKDSSIQCYIDTEPPYTKLGENKTQSKDLAVFYNDRDNIFIVRPDDKSCIDFESDSVWYRIKQKKNYSKNEIRSLLDSINLFLM